MIIPMFLKCIGRYKGDVSEEHALSLSMDGPSKSHQALCDRPKALGYESTVA